MFALAALVVAGAPSVAHVAYVVDGSAVLRADAKDDAAPLRELPIWTAVRIDVLDGAWAKVTVGPRVLRYDSPGGEARPTAPSSFDALFDAKPPVGWLHTSSLDAAPTSRLGLLAKAKDAPEGERKLWLLRAWALDPQDPDVAKQVLGSAARGPVGKTHAPFERVDLVVGCRGDVTKARVVVASVRPIGNDPPDACASHVDLRRPCVAGASGAGVGSRGDVARFVPRYASDGPALRLNAVQGASDRPVYVVTRLLTGECSADCTPIATSSDVHVDRLRVPLVADGRTILHVLVPRYTGALYDVVTQEPEGDGASFELGELFDVDPRDDPPRGDHLFIAPEACCSCNEEP